MISPLEPPDPGLAYDEWGALIEGHDAISPPGSELEPRDSLWTVSEVQGLLPASDPLAADELPPDWRALCGLLKRLPPACVPPATFATLVQRRVHGGALPSGIDQLRSPGSRAPPPPRPSSSRAGTPPRRPRPTAARRTPPAPPRRRRARARRRWPMAPTTWRRPARSPPGRSDSAENAPVGHTAASPSAGGSAGVTARASPTGARAPRRSSRCPRRCSTCSAPVGQPAQPTRRHRLFAVYLRPQLPALPGVARRRGAARAGLAAIRVHALRLARVRRWRRRGRAGGGGGGGGRRPGRAPPPRRCP